MPPTGATDLLPRYLTRVREVCPRLNIHHAVLVTDGGQYHDLLFANTDEGEVVFRFPRFPDGACRLDSVAHLLRALQGRVPLPVPNPRFVSPVPHEAGHAFIGYPRIPGESLQRDPVSTLDAATLHALVARAVDFLRALHAVPLDVAFPNASAPRDLLAEWRDLYTRIRH